MHSHYLATLKQRGWKSGSLSLLLWFALSVLSRAQESKQFLPEIDVYHSINPLVRISFQAKQTREAGDPTQAEIGPSIDFHPQPWIKLRDVTIFDLDEAKKWALVFTTGYRVLATPGAPATNRWELIATGNFPLRGGILLSDRNRADLDWQNGRFNWRYRNRLSLERSVNFSSYHPKVYVRSEEFYESQYQKWSTTALYAGGTFPIGRHLDIDPYYCHQNNTGRAPNEQLNQFGLIAIFYVSSAKK